LAALIRSSSIPIAGRMISGSPILNRSSCARLAGIGAVRNGLCLVPLTLGGSLGQLFQPGGLIRQDAAPNEAAGQTSPGGSARCSLPRTDGVRI
jgi:hypothetical protein